MQLVPVTNHATARQFLDINPFVNRGNPDYVRPLDIDILNVFDREKNKTYRFGEAVRWILKNDKEEVIGRVAAFINKKYRNKGDDIPVGGIGFFDCINNQDAADMLFDVAKHWLLQQGMEAMDGPINFGERDRWWGLLTEGFSAPVYQLNFNPPYYQSLFEHYGFKPFFEQYCFSKKIKNPIQQKFHDRHAIIAADPAFTATYMKHNDLGRLAQDFCSVYNQAWAGHGGLKEVSPEVMKKTFQTMKPVMDRQIIWFAYHNEEPVAMWINLPDLNQWFRHLDGKFDIVSKLKFLWLKATKPCVKCTGLVFGVIPKFQNKGVDAYLIIEAYKVVRDQLRYEDYEMQWIGDFNPKMISIAESLDTYKSRTLITYRYLFDRTKEFRRHPQI